MLIRLKENNYSSNIQKLRDSRIVSRKIPFPEFFGRKSPLGFEFWDLDLRKKSYLKATSASKDLLLIKHKLKSDGEIELLLVSKGVYVHSPTLFIIDLILSDKLCQ